MKNLLSYISEKLIFNKNTKAKYQNIDFNNINEDLLIDIIKSIFISVYKNRTYKVKGLSHYSIKRSEINWEDVIEILNTEYNHNVNPEYANDKNGELQKIARKCMDDIDKLINLNSIKMYFKEKNSYIILYGHDIYWQDWKDYVKKYGLKGY